MERHNGLRMIIVGVLAISLTTATFVMMSQDLKAESRTGREPTIKSPTVDTGKPLPPLDVTLDWKEKDLFPDRLTTMTLRIRPKHEEYSLRLRLEATGSVVVVSPTEEQVWGAPTAGRDIVLPVAVRTTGPGEGELRAMVEALDPSGELKYGRAVALVFLVTKDKVFAGTTGTLELELQHLEYRRSMGQLTDEEYRTEKERILGGGALTNP